MRAVVFLFVTTVLLSCNNEQAATPEITLPVEDSATVRTKFAEMVKFYGDPNSVYRNEDSLLVLLQQQLQSRWYSNLEKEAIQKRLTLTQQNWVGQPANDFVFLQPNGKRKSLYAVKADYVLLFFYNPECGACKEMKEKIVKSEILKSKVQSGKLKVVAIYTDLDEVIWRKHLPDMPTLWVHGRDEGEYLWKNRVYDLRAIPTVYLLDREKRVVLKDCMEVSLIEDILNGKTVN